MPPVIADESGPGLVIFASGLAGPAAAKALPRAVVRITPFDRHHHHLLRRPRSMLNNASPDRNPTAVDRGPTTNRA
jgi:hypothetical protein